MFSQTVGLLADAFFPLLNTHLLQMSKAELKDFFLLVVLSEGQSAKTQRNQIFLIPNDTTANDGFQ